MGYSSRCRMPWPLRQEIQYRLIEPAVSRACPPELLFHNATFPFRASSSRHHASGARYHLYSMSSLRGATTPFNEIDMTSHCSLVEDLPVRSHALSFNNCGTLARPSDKLKLH